MYFASKVQRGEQKYRQRPVECKQAVKLIAKVKWNES